MSETNYDLLKRANCQHLDLVVAEEVKTEAVKK